MTSTVPYVSVHGILLPPPCWPRLVLRTSHFLCRRFREAFLNASSWVKHPLHLTSVSLRKAFVSPHLLPLFAYPFRQLRCHLLQGAFSDPLANLGILLWASQAPQHMQDSIVTGVRRGGRWGQWQTGEMSPCQLPAQRSPSSRRCSWTQAGSGRSPC